MLITAGQLRAARAMVGHLQKTVAEKAGISQPTLARLEAGSGVLDVRLPVLRKLQAVYEAEGLIFENGDSPCVRTRPGVVL